MQISKELFNKTVSLENLARAWREFQSGKGKVFGKGGTGKK